MSRTLTRENPVRRTATSAILHGLHPLRGYPVTWHLTPLPHHAGPASFLVERADGHIVEDIVWQLAEKDVTVMNAAEMCELLRRAHG